MAGRPRQGRGEPCAALHRGDPCKSVQIFGSTLCAWHRKLRADELFAEMEEGATVMVTVALPDMPVEGLGPEGHEALGRFVAARVSESSLLERAA